MMNYDQVMAWVLSCHHKQSKEPLLQQSGNAPKDYMLIFNQFTKILNRGRRKRCLHTILRDGDRFNSYNSYRARNTELVMMIFLLDTLRHPLNPSKYLVPIDDIKNRSHGLDLAKLKKTNVLSLHA